MQNATFWAYADPYTGERRMALKSIRPIAKGDEILVDYGKAYFQKTEAERASRQTSARADGGGGGGGRRGAVAAGGGKRARQTSPGKGSAKRGARAAGKAREPAPAPAASADAPLPSPAVRAEPTGRADGAAVDQLRVDHVANAIGPSDVLEPLPPPDLRSCVQGAVAGWLPPPRLVRHVPRTVPWAQRADGETGGAGELGGASDNGCTSPGGAARAPLDGARAEGAATTGAVEAPVAAQLGAGVEAEAAEAARTEAGRTAGVEEAAGLAAIPSMQLDVREGPSAG